MRHSQLGREKISSGIRGVKREGKREAGGETTIGPWFCGVMSKRLVRYLC